MRSTYEFDAEIKGKRDAPNEQVLVYTIGSTLEEAEAELTFCASYKFTGKITPLSKDWQK